MQRADSSAFSSNSHTSAFLETAIAFWNTAEVLHAYLLFHYTEY